MAAIMRCTVAHFQGDEFVAADTILPVGDPKIIPAFFEQIEVPDEPAPKKTTTRKKSG